MKHLLFAMLLLFAGACSRPDDAPVLRRAGELLELHPDSALMLLQDVDAGELSRSDAALYAILLSRALDIAQADIAANSIIAPAIAYYDEKRDPLHYAMSRYYLGLVYFHSGSHARSLVTLLGAHDAAKEAGSDFWAAMTARGIADNYCRMLNAPEEKKYRYVSYDYFEKSGHRLHALYEMLDLGIGLHNHEEYDKATGVFRQVRDSAEISGNASLESEVLRCLGRSLYASGKYRESIEVYRLLDTKYELDERDVAFMGLGYANEGDLSAAQRVADEFSKNGECDPLLAVRIYSMVGDTVKAYEALEKLYYDTEKLLSKVTSQNISGSITDYYSKDKELREAEFQKTRLRSGLMVACALLVCVALGAYIIIYRKRKEEKLSHALMMAQELKDAYFSKEEECSVAQDTIRRLMQSRYDVFDNFCKAYFESRTGDIPYAKLTRVINDMVRSLREGTEEYDKLERYANDNFDGVMEKLKTDLPNLKKADCSLFLFSVFGFSINTIAAILGEDRVTTVYDRKKRLKRKLKELGEEKYLGYSRYLS